MRILDWFFRKKNKKAGEVLTATVPQPAPTAAEVAKQEEFGRVFRSDMDTATAMAYCREAAKLRAAWHDRINLARAEGIYRAVVKACPDFWIGHFGLGEVLTTDARRDRKGALATLQRAAQLAPKERAPFLELARELSDVGDFDAAVAYYAEATKLPPGIEEETFYPGDLQASAHWEAAIAMAKKGWEALAIEAFHRAIKLKPSYYISVIRPEDARAADCWRRAVQRHNSEADAKAAASGAAGNRCNRCGKDLGIEWHYSFESILIARDIGLQCSDCGSVLCSQDSKEGDKGISHCPKCSTRLVQMMEGPALASMVEQARRELRYRGAIKEPSILGRLVEIG